MLTEQYAQQLEECNEKNEQSRFEELLQNEFIELAFMKFFKVLQNLLPALQSEPDRGSK